MRNINQILLKMIIVVSFLFSVCVLYGLRPNASKPIYVVAPPLIIQISDDGHNESQEEDVRPLRMDAFTNYLGVMNQ